eukprot:jgi/Tetstr1/461535/TSEL_006641.t1
MREAWGRLQAAIAGHLGDADARQMEREVEAASGSQKELTAFLDQANNSRLRNEVCALPATCRERILFNQLDVASCMWTVAIPTARTAMTPHELREVAAGYFFLPSPCLAPVVGCQIILPSTEHNPVIVDLYGDALMNLPALGDAHWRVQHDAIADAFRDHCVHDLGMAVRREVDDLFQHAVPLGNTVPRDELKDLVLDAELSLPAFNVVTGSYDPRSLKSTLLEFKTMRYGVKYTSVPRATAVDRFERSLLGDIKRRLAARDAAWHNTEPGQKGPLRDILDMSEYTGMVFGTVGEVSKGVHRTAQAAARNAENAAKKAGWNKGAKQPRVLSKKAETPEEVEEEEAAAGTDHEEEQGDEGADDDNTAEEQEEGDVEAEEEQGREQDQEDMLPDFVLDGLASRAEGKDEGVGASGKGESKRKRSKQSKSARRKKAALFQKGPVQVAVLDAQERAAASGRAQSFLQERLYTSKKRSDLMLMPVSTLRRVGPAAKFV